MIFIAIFNSKALSRMNYFKWIVCEIVVKFTWNSNIDNIVFSDSLYKVTNCQSHRNKVWNYLSSKQPVNQALDTGLNEDYNAVACWHFCNGWILILFNSSLLINVLVVADFEMTSLYCLLCLQMPVYKNNYTVVSIYQGTLVE